MVWGLHIVKKMWYFLLLLPILITIVKKKDIKYYIAAFLLAMTITEILSYLIWFEVIPPFKYASAENPTPFMSHISYNPILAFAFYLVCHEALFNKSMSLVYRLTYSLFSLTMCINMFITGGRAGQVMFFIALLILVFQVFGIRIKAFIIAPILVVSVFLIAYNNSQLFHERVDSIQSEIKDYPESRGKSVGIRLAYAVNSWEIIKNNFFFGVGTGDFPNEYKKINLRDTPELTSTKNPHNMYTLTLSQLGLFGLSSLLYLLYVQLRLSFFNKSKFLSDVGLALPTMFIVIMWSDSYLLGHYTTLMFVFFSSFLYKNPEKS
jgi:O-antigen ligase